MSDGKAAMTGVTAVAMNDDGGRIGGNDDSELVSDGKTIMRGVTAVPMRCSNDDSNKLQQVVIDNNQ